MLDAKPYGLPAAVIGLHATPAPSSVTLTWDPVDDNGSPITAYNVIRWSAASEGWIFDSVADDGDHAHVLRPGDRHLLLHDRGHQRRRHRAAQRAPHDGGRRRQRCRKLRGTIWTSVDDAPMTMTWVSGDAGTSPITGHLVQYSTDEITWTTVPSGLG